LALIADAQPHDALRIYRVAAEELDRLGPALLAALARDLSSAVRDSHESAATVARNHLIRRPLREAEGSSLFDWLFPPPDPEQVRGWVFDSGWEDRMAALTALAAPQSLAALIAQGVQASETPEQIARRIRPAVQGVQTSARRVARTESLRVAHVAQMETYERLGDLVVGYQIHATLDGNTRLEHRRRDGTIYYRRPAAGQKGMHEMPRPPMEADGTPAFNCRCYLTPILS